MAKLTKEELLSAFKDMTLIELSDFVKDFEEMFDVKAMMPAAMPAGNISADDDSSKEEKNEFNVHLDSVGDKKIAVIKEVRSLTGLGLKEAKDLVDAAPKVILEGASKADAEKAKESLEAVGATITLK